MKFLKNAGILVVVGLIIYIGNYIAYVMTRTPETPPFDPVAAMLGMAIIVGAALAGWFLSENVKIKLESPTVIWVSIVSLLITSPIFPGNQWISSVTNQISFMATTTPVLAYAGLSLGKDIGKFRQLGWRIVVVSLLVFTGTFVLATVFAQAILKLNGTI